jgi:predicted membrane-bound spermidine synthase
MIVGVTVPWTELGRAVAPGGAELVLRGRDGGFEIRIDGRELMASRGHASEEAMARLACAAIAGLVAPRVLIGGLGMGYTLRAALDALPQAARVIVAELVPEIVAWNRGPLAALAGRPLDDPRVSVAINDVGIVIRDSSGTPPPLAGEVRVGGNGITSDERVSRRLRSPHPDPPPQAGEGGSGVSHQAFDAILLDVDNGPATVTREDNHPLYAVEGLAQARRALRAGGILAVWSADPSPEFLARLGAAGFAARGVAVPARGDAGGPEHTIFLAAA